MPRNDENNSGTFELVGPFESHDVIVAGRQVPFLVAHPEDGGKVHLTLDRRLGITLTVSEAERIIPFLADAIAVASGYTSHPHDEPRERHPFPRVIGLA